MRGRAVFTALFVLVAVARALDFAIFPPRSTVQCLIDGKAISNFPTLAKLGEEFGDKGALASRATTSSFGDKIAYYAFAVLPLPPNKNQPTCNDDDDEDWETVTFVSFTEKMSAANLRDGIVAMAGGGARGDFKPEFSIDDIDGGFKMAVSSNELETFFLAMASDTLAVIAPREDAMRESVAAVRDGTAVRPEVGADNPLAWLSATIDPVAIFDDKESYGGMAFLSDLGKLTVVADGNADDGSIAIAATGAFSSRNSAEAASGMLSALLQMTAFSSDTTNPLIALGKRAKVAADGNLCRIRAVFSKEDIESFIGAMVAGTGGDELE